MVTCARTRGSMMKFLPVAAATASAICVMSASLKLGVMRCACGACCACCACCAEASEAAARTASARTANERKPVTGSTPRKKRAGRLLVAAVPARHFGGRGHLRHGHRRLVGRRRRRRQALRFLRDLGDVQGELLLLAAANERDARLARAAQG